MLKILINLRVYNSSILTLKWRHIYEFVFATNLLIKRYENSAISNGKRFEILEVQGQGQGQVCSNGRIVSVN